MSAAKVIGAVRQNDNLVDLFPFVESVAKHAQQGDHAEGYFDAVDNRWKYKRTYRPLDDDILRRHLSGGAPVAVYPMASGGDATRLAQFDLDDKKAELPWESMAKAAQKIIDVAIAWNLEPWAVRSGGGHGINVWFKWDEAQPADAVWHCLTAILQAAGFQEGADGGVAMGRVEIFPKQGRAGKRGPSLAVPFGRLSVPLGPDLSPANQPLSWLRSAPVPHIRPQDTRAEPAGASGIIGDAARELRRLKSALRLVDPDDRDCWIGAGIALKRDFGDDGYELWHWWSEEFDRSNKYKGEDETRKTWDGLEPRSENPITVASIYRWARDHGWQDDTRLILIFDPTDPKRMAREGEAALLASFTRLYQQGGKLVRVVRLGEHSEKRAIIRDAGALILQPANAVWLVAEFMEAAIWRKRTKTGDLVPAILPRTIGETYLEMLDEWRMPHLAGTVETPTLYKSDEDVTGYRLLQTPGYDLQSQLYYDPGSLAFPPVPEHPTKEDAVRSLDLFLSLLEEFPFVPDDPPPDDWEPAPDEGKNRSRARSVIISAWLVSFIRRTMDAVPMHAIDSVAAGTGKSLIAQILSTILTGRRPAAMPWIRNEEEQRKRILSVLMEGDPVVLFDNADTTIGGAPLNIMLSEPVFRDRVLGKTQAASASTNCLVLATGNNLVFEADTTRRVVRCKLDARTERPQDRKFSAHPLAGVRRRRGEFVVAALTILRAYLAAGRPLNGKVPHVGSYEDWTLIREAIVWLDQPDPADTMKEITADDPAANVLRHMMDAWCECYGGQAMKLADAVADALAGSDRFHSYLADSSMQAKRRLFDAMSVALDGKEPNALRVGHWFSKHHGQIIDDCRFVRGGDGKHTPRTITLIKPGSASERGTLNPAITHPAVTQM